MAGMGNKLVNSFLEYHVPHKWLKPSHLEPRDYRESYIRVSQEEFIYTTSTTTTTTRLTSILACCLSSAAAREQSEHESVRAAVVAVAWAVSEHRYEAVDGFENATN